MALQPDQAQPARQPALERALNRVAIGTLNRPAPPNNSAAASTNLTAMASPLIRAAARTSFKPKRYVVHQFQ